MCTSSTPRSCPRTRCWYARAADAADADAGLLALVVARSRICRASSIWDTLRNTIEDERPDAVPRSSTRRTGACGHDDADRSEKQTIVQRLINGANGVPPMPVVWGISATVERFDEAMERSRGPHARTAVGHRRPDPRAGVRPAQGRHPLSTSPAETGTFDTVLLRRATRKVVESTALWTQHTQTYKTRSMTRSSHCSSSRSPNTPSGRATAVGVRHDLHEAWPDLRFDRDGTRVRRAHDASKFGACEVDYDRAAARPGRHARPCAVREGCDLDWVGLPSCGGPRVVPPGKGPDTHHPVARPDGPSPARAPHPRRRPVELGGVPAAAVRPQDGYRRGRSPAREEHRDEDGTGGSGGGGGRRVLIAPVDMDANVAIRRNLGGVRRLPSQTLPQAPPEAGQAARARSPKPSRAMRLRPTRGRTPTRPSCYGVLDGLTRPLQREELERSRSRNPRGRRRDASSPVALCTTAPKPGSRFTEVADDRSVEARLQGRRSSAVARPAAAYADHIAVSDRGRRRPLSTPTSR